MSSSTQAVEKLREELLNIAKRNSACINRQLSATEYQAEVWPLANNAIEEIMSALADTFKIVGEEIVPKDREYGQYDLPEVIEQIKSENRQNVIIRQRLELVVGEMRGK